MSRCTCLSAKSRLLLNFTLSHRLLFFTVVAMLVLGGVGISNSSAVKQSLYVLAGNSDATPSTNPRAGAITVHAAGRGKPFLNLRDGREGSVNYSGDKQAAGALQSGAAQARSLASADFDRNGTPDVVAGYAFNGAGLITLQRGNPDAFAPADDSVFVRMEQGYDPDSLLPGADVYAVPVSPDFLVTGNFTRDAAKDVLFAAKGGALFLMRGNGGGGLDSPQQIDLPGPVTALGAGEFRAADGFTDVAVGVSGPGGESLLIFDAAEGLSDVLVQYQLAEPALGIEFGGLDDDPFMDIAVASGSEILVVHGWGRKEQTVESVREERIKVGASVRGLALGAFTWDREGRSEIAALTSDGAIQIVQNSKLDRRPFSEAEAAQRTRGNPKLQAGAITQDVESVPSWRPGKSAGWARAEKIAASSVSEVSSSSTKPLMRTNLAFRETDDLILNVANQRKLEIVRPIAPSEKSLGAFGEKKVATTSLDVESAPVAVLTLPKKLNGVQDVVLLSSANAEPLIVPNAPNTTITVDRTDDPSGAGLTAASACTAAGNDCSLRGAIQFANQPANNNTTISLPANTYILSINGTGAVGCDGNTVGDLGANQTMSIVGAGAATTIVRQTGTGPANDGDRVMCMNEVFSVGLVYNFSGVTFVGGREGTAAGTGAVIGGAGIIGGELNNSLTLTNVVFANNQETVQGSANLGGGGLQITGGNLIITNSTFGGSSAPGAYTDRSSTNTANSQAGSGGGIVFTPSSPQHAGGTGTLTITGSTFSRNTAASVGSGGGGADLLTFAFAAPGGIGSGSATISTSTFSNNQAIPGNGGGILVESLATTVATTSFTSNSAGNRGGGIFVAGASLHLNGTSPSITFTGNTAASGGSSVSTSAAVTVSGTNTTIGGDIEVNTLGSWTNNAGSTLAPTNVVVTGGTFNMNNSTMNVGGNLTIGPGPIVGSTFNGNTGTVNIQGNFVLNAGGAPATTLNAGTSTFNFNGTGAQSITNGTAITFFNLTDSNVTNPLTLNNSLAVNGALNVNGVNAILSPVAAAVISGTGTLSGTGTARVSRLAAVPDFLSQYTITNKTLTNLTIDYSGAGNQTVNNTPAYSQLRISGSGTKTLQGNTIITSNLTIAAATLASGNFNFALGGNWTNNVGVGGFTAGTGTVTFQGSSGIQTLTGNTTFFNLTLNNAGATTNFSNTVTTIGNDLVATAGTMDGGTSSIIFTGVTDNAGSISGAAAKNFHNLQINAPAVITHNSGANITIEGNYLNGGTFNQGPALTTIFDVDNAADGVHTLAGIGATTFGNFTINASNSVDATTHNFNVVGAAFTSNGTFTGNVGTVTFNGLVAQSITGDGVKNFGGLFINNVNGVSLLNSAPLAVDAAVLGLLTLNTDLTVVPGAILQQGGSSAGAADVLGTVRRTDLGGIARSFGNVNNQVTINSGTPPTVLDFNLVKATPTGFPVGVRVVPRTYTLTPTGGAGISATLRLRYIDPAELAGPGITESRLVLWKDTTGADNWLAQGGTVDTVNNHVTHTGITSFSEWAIAEAADLTLSKANNVSGNAVVGQSWNWTLTASNTGSPATFTAGQTIITDNLPSSNLNYGTPTVENATNITGSANISCAIVSNDLTCTASGGSVTFDSNIGASSFEVVFSATPQAAGSYQNPRTGGGIAQIDPNNVIVESNETNNSPAANTVTVGKANTTTTITADNPDPSVVGEAVSVQWTVTVNSPGALGAPLTGNVTVSDGTDSCVADVSAGQCNITFTSAGAKSLTATYAGDLNYNGSASTPATPHTVNKSNTTTTITADNPDPSTPGQSVTVEWTVTVDSPGSGTPTGNVTVTVSGGAETCSAPVATGQCSLVLNTTGPRTITATYAGDTNFNTSFDTEEHTVCGDSVVTSTADSGAGSLRQIIADACDNSTITFDIAGDGPHTITLTTGELVIAKNLTINNDSGETITISGNNASRVFNINTGMTVAILDLTLTNGKAADGADGGAGVGGFGEDGGAILNDGTLTLTRVNVTNSRSGNGGDSTSIPGEAGKGGGIYSTGSLTMNDCDVSGNFGGNGGDGPNGGGRGGDGGGIFFFGGTGALTDVTINSNTAGNSGNDVNGFGGMGGGLFVRLTSSVNVVASAITNNDSGTSPGTDGFGGGLQNEGALTIVSSEISGNSTEGPGGGIMNRPSGNLTLINTTISGNHATSGGHGVFSDNSTMVISNCTITNNSPSSSSGVGVFTTGGSAQAGNTIIAGNGGASGSDLNTGGLFTSLGNNLIGKSDGSNGFTSGVNGDQVGTLALPINALLGPLANNGGPTQTHALLLGSPAIETGNNAIVAADTLDLDGDTNTSEPIPFDQRGTGFPRVMDSADANIVQTIDIGAFELHPSIEDIANQSSNENMVKNVLFNLGDDTGALIASVTATSSNTTLVPNANLVITGSGGSRNLQITPAANQTGTTTITVTVTATNGRTAVDTFDLTVNAVNDAPVANNDSYSTDEDTPLVVNAASGVLSNDTDVDTPLASLTAILVSGPANALSFTLNADGSFNYTPNANFNGSDSFTYKANDGNLDSNVGTVTLTVNAINDPPVNLVPASLGTAQNTPIVFSAANSNQISVADPDAGTNGLQVTLTAANGTLTLSGTTGLSFSFSDGNGTGAGDGVADTTMTFRGTLANINAALNGLSFTPTVDFSGTASLTITSNDLGNTGSGGPLSDTDVVNIQVATNISIQDAQVAEPSSASVSMLFTVTLSAPAPVGGASVNFTTADEPPSTGHAVAGEDYTTTLGTVNFAVGEQFKTISVPILADGNSSEPNETFLVTLSSPVNAIIVDGSATGTILVAEQPGAILISELRTSGPAGDGDDFVEIYNNSASSHTVAASDSSSGYGLFKMGSSCGVAPVLIGVIPNGTVIPGRGHFLFAGSAYSLTAYGALDQTMSSDIESDRNVGIFSTSNLAALSSANRLDAVGFGANSGGNCDLLREGATLTPVVGSVVNHSFFRDECGKKGNPAHFGPCPTGGFVKDSGINNDDFIFADTQGTMTPAGQRLGAPGPQNLGSPRLNLSIPAVLLDNTIAAAAPPNRFRDTGAIGPNAANGTMSIRRRFVNSTGAPVTRLRFRIVDTSSFPVSIPVADLRVLSSSAFTVNGVLDPATCLASNGSATTPCTITVQGTTLETPPAQPLGGAINSSLNAGTIVLATPLAPGASINLQFLLGVQSTGSFKFFFNIEALP